MKKSLNKSYSNLDLKLLDVKFITIDDNQTYLTEALQQVRRTKMSQFPSLLKSRSKQKGQTFGEDTINDSSAVFSNDAKNKTTLQINSRFDESILSNNFRATQFSCLDEPMLKNSQIKSNFGKIHAEQDKYNEIQRLKEEIKLRKLNQKLQRNRSLPSLIFPQNKLKNLEEKRQIEKYRRKIQHVKKENASIHKQISSLYRNKLSQNKQPLKKVRKIQPFRMESSKNQTAVTSFSSLAKSTAKHNITDTSNVKRTLEGQKMIKRSLINHQSSPKNIKISSDQVIKQKLSFYENLVQKTPYKEQLQNIHKKIVSNNLHKNFQQYLISANKRIPQFIKKLRN